jgi:hypothetical protein
MYGIYWAAVIVTAVAGFVAVVAWRAWDKDRYAFAAFAIGLPLSALVNEYVKAPLISAIQGVAWPGRAGPAPWGFLLAALWVAPLTEEAVKLLPLTIPGLRSSLDRPSSALKYGMGSGFGFGLGEAWYLAWGITHSQAYARLPFYYFTGYISERLVVCFAHGVMTSVAMTGIARGGPAAAGGYLGAAALHALLNIGALLHQARLAGPYAPSLAMLVSLIVLAAVFERLRLQAFPAGSAAGRVVWVKKTPGEAEPPSRKEGES